MPHPCFWNTSRDDDHHFPGQAIPNAIVLSLNFFSPNTYLNLSWRVGNCLNQFSFLVSDATQTGSFLCMKDLNKLSGWDSAGTRLGRRQCLHNITSLVPVACWGGIWTHPHRLGPALYPDKSAEQLDMLAQQHLVGDRRSRAVWGQRQPWRHQLWGAPVCSHLLRAGSPRELNRQGLSSLWHCGWILAWSQLLPVNPIHTEAATAPAGSCRETQFPMSQVEGVHGHCPGLEKGNHSGPGCRKVLRQHVEGWALGQDEHCIFSCKMQSGFALTAGHRRQQGCTSRDTGRRGNGAGQILQVWKVGGGGVSPGEVTGAVPCVPAAPAQPCPACYHFPSPAQGLSALGHGWMRHRGAADPRGPLPQAVPSPPRLPSSP